MGSNSKVRVTRALFYHLVFAPVSTAGSSLIKIFRYLVVGGVAWLIDYGLLVFLTHQLGADIVLAATVGFSFGLLTNFLLSLKWVFGLSRFTSSAFFVFLLTGLFGLVINDALLWAFYSYSDIPLTICKVVTTIVILGWNFFGRMALLRLIGMRSIDQATVQAETTFVPD